MYCAQCGTECPPEYQFCKNCGVTLPQNNGSTAVSSSGTAAQPIAAQTYPGGPQVVYYATPQAAAQAHTAHQLDLLKTLRTRLQAIASTEDLQGFSLSEMFSEVFKRRSPAEVEDYLLVGTSKTTPPIDVVETGWPKPWLFFRVLAFLVIAFVGFTFTLYRFQSLNHIPAILMVGAFAVPLATLTFFFEMNTPRNVSVQRIATLLISGAVLSLLFAMIGYDLPGVSSSPSLLVAGIVEECAKLATVILVIRSVKYKYILNGLLFGATVGAAFAAFETAGYAVLNQAPYILQNGQQTIQIIPSSFLNGALVGLIKAGGDIFNPQQIGAAALSGASSMIAELRGRAIDAPFTHIAWTAIAAAALWRVKKDQKFRFSMLKDPLFLKAFMIPIVLHTIWDFPYYQLPYYGNEILCGFIAWYVLFGLIQQGLRQVQAEQRMHLQTTLSHVEASLQSTPVAAGAGQSAPVAATAN